jgi:hypothetical protein
MRAFALLFFCFITMQALAQDPMYYYNFPLANLPEGISITLETDIIIPALTHEVRIGITTTGPKCYFKVDEDKIRKFDQIIVSGTALLAARRYNYGFYFYPRGYSGIHCSENSLTMGDVMNALKGVISFKFPEAPKPQELKF